MKVQIRFRAPNGNLNYETDVEEMDVFGDKAMEVVSMAPSDSQGYRQVVKYTKADPNTFDPEWVKLGYAYGMAKKDPVKGVCLRMPSKDTAIRELFNYTDKRCSFWSNDYDMSVDKLFPVKVPRNFKEQYTRELPKDKFTSFMRGLFAANGCINLKNKIISAPLDFFLFKGS